MKTAGLPVALCGPNFGVASTKDLPILVVSNEKFFFLVLVFKFFVSDAISGVLLGHFGPLYLALGPNL